MSRFYQEIEPYYEDIFKPRPPQLKLLKASAPGKRVLDLACATGAVAAALAAETDFDVTALDLEASMIERAKQKPGITAVVGDMLAPPKGPFDLIYCIGNSLPHLPTAEKIAEFFQVTYDRLATPGTLVLQWINFAPFLKQEGKELGTLSTIENDRVKFERFYRRDGEYIAFDTILTVDGKQFDNRERLFPLLTEDARRYALDAGYEDIEFFGNFNGDPLDLETSVPVVMRCRKKER